MTKKQFYFLLGFILIIVLIITNPNEQKHIETVKTKLKIALKKKMTSEITDENNSLGGGLGLLFGDALIDKMTDGFISRNNYLLFSTTKAEYKGQNKTIGIGILGNVYISDKINNIFSKENTSNEGEEHSEITKTLQGKLITELHYGSPGYGEDPENDKKVYPYILVLNKPIDLIEEGNFRKSEYGKSFDNVEKIQLTGDFDFSKFKGKEVEITGTLFESDNGNHFTDVLMTVSNINSIE